MLTKEEVVLLADHQHQPLKINNKTITSLNPIEVKLTLDKMQLFILQNMIKRVKVNLKEMQMMKSQQIRKLMTEKVVLKTDSYLQATDFTWGVQLMILLPETN